MIEPSNPDRETIRTAELFEKLDRHPDPVPDPKIDSLPLNERLTPSNFEKLIARLAAPSSGSEVQAFRYGKSGSTQGGVDVICIDAAARKCDCFEGKRVVEIKKGEIADWVEKFLSGPHAEDARSFHLCTTYPITEKTDLFLEWKQCAYLLASKEITPGLWDRDELLKMLHRRRDIVSELFGDDVAGRYCYQQSPEVDAPPEQSFGEKVVSVFGRMASMENVSIACELSLPAAENLSLTAILLFARKDLSGTTIAASGREMVHWMQWRAHADELAERPYAIPFHSDSSRYIFQGNAARLTLNNGELNDLDWILARAWQEFLRSSKEVLGPLRCHRFRPLNHSESFGLISVRRELWRAMLDYASEHDFAKGNSEWHCFDGAPGCLKVYSKADGARFDRGHHAILYAHNDVGVWLPWESNVVIAWEPPTDIDGSPSTISPRKSWDAEYTHDWLLREFIPEVLRWIAVPQEQAQPKSFWKSAPRARQEPVKVDQVAWSRASGPGWKVMPNENLTDLIKCVQALQSHANGRRPDVPIPAKLMQCVLRAIDRTLPFAQLTSTQYLRSSLRIDEDIGIGNEIRRRETNWSKSSHYAELDYFLRALLEVLEAAPKLPAGELGHIAATLQPLLDRYHEDIMCDIFTSK